MINEYFIIKEELEKMGINDERITVLLSIVKNLKKSKSLDLDLKLLFDMVYKYELTRSALFVTTLIRLIGGVLNEI